MVPVRWHVKTVKKDLLIVHLVKMEQSFAPLVMGKQRKNVTNVMGKALTNAKTAVVPEKNLSGKSVFYVMDRELLSQGVHTVMGKDIIRKLSLKLLLVTIAEAVDAKRRHVLLAWAIKEIITRRPVICVMVRDYQKIPVQSVMAKK
jgi:hypothetical protein